MSVKVYSKPGCDACVLVKNWLNDNDIEFEEIDVKKKKGSMTHITQDLNLQGLPVVESDNYKPFVGFSLDDLEGLKQSLNTKIIQWNKEKLQKDIEKFPQVHPITEDMNIVREGVSRMIMLERYAFKDIENSTLGEGDLVIAIVKNDPSYPVKGIGIVQSINNNTVDILLEEQYRGSLVDEKEIETGIITRNKHEVNKPLEVYYEQIAKRVAKGLSKVEETEEKREQSKEKFEKALLNEEIVPAGRVLYGAGSEQDVTFFNCYVSMPPQDSREGIAEHRGLAVEIMARGGGIGTNGSSLRPRNSIAKGVNGKSSGAVSWLNDLAQLTHLVEQGGSRRGKLTLSSNF